MSALASIDGQRSSTVTSLLDVRGLYTYFPRVGGPAVRAVDGVDLSVYPGTTVGVVGESGSGKSMLARSILGALPRHAVVPRTSTVRFDEVDVRSLSGQALRRFWGTSVALVFQDALAALNPAVRVGRQLMEPMRFHLGLGRRDARDRALELMRSVGIPEPEIRFRQYPHELSGGMRQRVVIAIALACRPRLLIADEPTTALDVTVQRQILDLLSALQSNDSTSMILITHDLGVAASRTDEIAVMYAGRIVERAPTSALFATPRHPYTAALLESIPRLDEVAHTRLRPIAGRPARVVGRRTGCSFASRCPHVQSDCRAVDPPVLVDRIAGQEVACHHPLGGLTVSRRPVDPNRTRPTREDIR